MLTLNAEILEYLVVYWDFLYTTEWVTLQSADKCITESSQKESFMQMT